VNSAGQSSLSVSVAILTWNRREYVLRAVESVYSQTYKPCEVVVVDSDSNDGTIESIALQFPSVKLVRLHRNMGCPEGRNIALANCHGDIIFSLDDDAFLASDVLDLCVQRMVANDGIGVVTCKILDPNEAPSSKEADYFRTAFDGGACAFRKSALRSAGYYPHDFFRQAEEGDLGLRLIENGYEILACPQAIVYHAKAPINRDQRLFLFYSVRNELYTVLRQYPWILVGPAVLYKMFVWNMAGLRKLAFVHTVLGTLAALVRAPRLLCERKAVSINTVRNLLSLKAKARQSSCP
jgi:GT2 family glycosyltransferase